MKINIVNYEQGRFNGILSKFANKLNEELIKLGQESYITALPDNKADITHHINYLPYHYENSPDTKNTLMITHLNFDFKLDALKKGMETAEAGICMSSAMPKYLFEQGIDDAKLFSVRPAHDGKPRRPQIVAILTNVYPDGCKREGMFRELVKTLNKNEWAFRIMGSGWEEILPDLVAEGLQVDYFHDFNADVHQKILETSDYALYFGEDEGSMGLLDAANAGVKTIGTPQGFHLDMGLDYSFTTQDELNTVFAGLNKNNVRDWTWDRYAKIHLSIWKSLCEK